MKKSYISLVILVTYSTLMTLLIGSSSTMAGECTKFEVIKLIDKGFTKQQIEKICNESVIVEETMCCCEIKNFQFISIPIPLTVEPETGFPYTKWEWLPESTRYEWMESSRCLSQSDKEMFNRKEAKCIMPINCGK
jgi:hypothetical protein